MNIKGIISEKEARMMSYAVSSCFFIIHVLMFIMFLTYGVTPMAIINVFSMFYYIGTLIMIYKNRLYEFVVLTYFEVVAHMCMATYFTGWINEFQITLIGLSILLFFAEYVGRLIEAKHIHATPLCIMGMFAYLITLYLDHNHNIPYPLPEHVSYFLQASWAIVVFVITIAFLHIFVMVTFHSEQFLSRKASQDELTGLLNRFTANNLLDDFIKRNEISNSWVSMIDIDDFKKVNDTYGHNCGDYVLVTLARIMKDRFDDSSCFRWGGEEFLIFDNSSEEKADAYEKMEQLRKSVEEYEFDYDGRKLHMTITAGIAFYEKGLSKEEWINKADIKLYEGKRSGKNKILM
ncbi:MAG: GGDEF domain-containing protein [Erysipelotrichaceae bacterium]|nr:GGDEF domain-containing protein [Erysipelotrichaceae bacterium]